MKSFILLSLLLFPVLGLATDGSVKTRSAGKYLSDQSVQLEQKLASSPLVESSNVARERLVHGADETIEELQARSLAQHPLPVSFDIFDAWVVLSNDFDDDGYFHHLNVVFDADTSADLETVYVKLYLSREGGDWVQYATSDLFEIHYDSVDDTYEVATELVEGYLPSQYDVLIELHSLFHPGVVASRIVTLDDAGFAIALEDRQHDEAHRLVVVDDGYVNGSGSVSLVGMLMLAMLLWIKVRYFAVRKE